MITRTILIKKAFKNLKAQFNYFFVDLKYILNAKSSKFFLKLLKTFLRLTNHKFIDSFKNNKYRR